MEPRQPRIIMPKPTNEEPMRSSPEVFKHKRLAVRQACERCRELKIRCDESPPCLPCARVNHSCHFRREPRHRSRQAKEPTAASNTVGHGYDGLESSSRRLEWQGEVIPNCLNGSAEQGWSAWPATTPSYPSLPQPALNTSFASQNIFIKLPVSKCTITSHDNALMTHLWNLLCANNCITQILSSQNLFTDSLCIEDPILSGALGSERLKIFSGVLLHSLLTLPTYYRAWYLIEAQIAELSRWYADYSQVYLLDGNLTPSLYVFQSIVALWAVEHTSGNLAGANGLLRLIDILYPELNNAWAASLALWL
uniref:Zn(2)-C6 fungal-type domain-containing protein n=1 Tax=Bionectria ochroleuca TaxID=29856 RepID=A0A8H7KBC4_BIOOC